jgi:hypothetical protein
MTQNWGCKAKRFVTRRQVLTSKPPNLTKVTFSRSKPPIRCASEINCGEVRMLPVVAELGGLVPAILEFPNSTLGRGRDSGQF